MPISFFSLWLVSMQSWATRACELSLLELHRQQAQAFGNIVEQVGRSWTGAWLSAALSGRRSVADRMAERSLRVVEGGRG